MRAYVLRQANSTGISHMPGPIFSSEEVVVRMKVVSICQTDSKIITGLMKTKKLPIILGHEGGGIVENVGSNVHVLAKHDRVLIDPNIRDFTCSQCRNGRSQLCENGGLMGKDGDGLFAETIKISPTCLYRLPESIKDDIVPLLQPLSTAVHASKKINISPGDVIVVMGLGPSGLLLSSVAKSRGATVIGASRSKKKLELSRKFGVDHAVNMVDQNIIQEVREITAGQGADVTIEAVGDPELLRLCFDLVKPGGTVLQFGISNSDASYSMYTFYEKELNLIGTRSSVPADFLSAMGLAASGRVNLDSLVTARFRFDEMDNAIKASSVKSGNLKVTVTF